MSTTEGRYEMNDILKSCVPAGTDPNRIRVWFQPDETSKLTYPCILYQRKFSNTTRANNDNYRTMVAYQVTIIQTSDSSEILNNVLSNFANSRHDNEFISDGLNHSIVTVYYRI